MPFCQITSKIPLTNFSSKSSSMILGTLDLSILEDPPEKKNHMMTEFLKYVGLIRRNDYI